MAGLEDLASGLKAFRRTPKEIHAAYLEPMLPTLRILNAAKAALEKETKNPENYCVSNTYAFRPDADISLIDVDSLIAWLIELRGLNLSNLDFESLTRLGALERVSALRGIYHLPQSGYVKRRYGLLAAQAESDVGAIAATIPYDGIGGIAPMLIYFAQLKLNSGTNISAICPSLLEKYGIDVSSVAPQDLESILSELATGHGYSVSLVCKKTDLNGIVSDALARLGLQWEGLPSLFLLRKRGDPQGFLTVTNDGNKREGYPLLYATTFVQNDASAALKLCEGVAKHLGYGAVKVRLLLDKDARQAVAYAGLYFWMVSGTEENRLAGVFVDVLDASKEEKQRYGISTKCKVECALDYVRESEKSRQKREAIAAAAWDNLTLDEMRQQRIPGDKVKLVVVETSAQGGRSDSVCFSFGNNLNLIYLSNRAEAKSAAKFFNADNVIVPGQFFSEPSSGESDSGFYLGRQRRGSWALLRAQTSVDDAVRYITKRAKRAGSPQVSVHVRCCGLSPEELLNSNLPLDKLSVIKEVVVTNLLPKELERKSIPPYVCEAKLKVFDAAMPFFAHYRSIDGAPQLDVVPAAPVLGVSLKTLEDAAKRTVTALWLHYSSQDGQMVNVVGVPEFKETVKEAGQAVIRLGALPSPYAIRATFDSLFPASYLISELRWRVGAEGKTLART